MNLRQVQIIQLVPQLPPHPDGIGDYSLRLAEELMKEDEIFTRFIAYGYAKEIPQIEPIINGFSTIRLPARTPESFLSCLPENIQAIIFHYGFKGQNIRSPTALWLLKALRLTARLRRLKLVVMFHELTLTLKLKGITFFHPPFFHPFHFFAARGIARTADAVLTDSARFQAILSKWLKRPVTCIPDFSTIGEPEQVPPLVERDRRMIVFGKPYSRERVYKKFLKELLSSCQILRIEEIYDIGESLKLNLPEFSGVHVVEMGEQPPEVISQLMLSSLAGFFDYSLWPGDLGKSTVFAAFCAHGLIPVSSQYNPSEATGLEINKHYVVPDEQLKNMNLRQLQSIADNARQWYGTHTLTKNAKVFASCFLAEVEMARARTS